jgi:hypothetical protein
MVFGAAKVVNVEVSLKLSIKTAYYEPTLQIQWTGTISCLDPQKLQWLGLGALGVTICLILCITLDMFQGQRIVLIYTSWWSI